MTASTIDIDPIDYAERWRRIVEARRQHMDALYARVERSTTNFWATRSEWFRPSAQRQLGPDPFLAAVTARVTPAATVLDVGAGGGRYAIPLAARAREVVAVEPAEPMVRVMREEAELAGVRNLRIVQGDWLEAAVEPADIVICSHVIYPIADVVPFLEKLHSATKGTCLLYLNAGQPPWEDPDLWLRLHDQPMRPQPTYIDAYNVLHQLGIFADVTIVTFLRRSAMREPTFEAAAERFRDTLILDQRPETTARLHEVLRDTLVQKDDGWQLPPQPAQAAIISWTKHS